MHFKLIVAFVETDRADATINAARDKGAKGSTIISQARGEGIDKEKTFFGLSVERHTDIILFIVEEHLSRVILEAIAKAAKFDDKDDDNKGIAFQVDVEDAVGLSHQIQELNKTIKEKI